MGIAPAGEEDGVEIRCPCGLSHESDAAGCRAWSRRGLLRSGFAMAAALSAGEGAMRGHAGIARAQNDVSPEQAVRELMAGNKRFTSRQITSFDEDLKALKE